MNSSETAINKKLWNKFHQEPDWFITLGEKLKFYKSGGFSQYIVDCVYQYSWHKTPDIYDMYILNQIYIKLQGDNPTIGVFQIPTDTTPFPDKEIEQNNLILSQLPAPFKGIFWGGTQDEDGEISWKTPIHCTICGKNEYKNDALWCLIDPRAAPLEVGYNSSQKFLRDLNWRGLVARWPYGHKYISVFVDFDSVTRYLPTDPNFDAILMEANESVDDALESKRSPWELWNNMSIVET